MAAPRTPQLRVLPLALLLLLLPTLPPPARAASPPAVRGRRRAAEAETCAKLEIETKEKCSKACKPNPASSFGVKNGAATCKCPIGDDKFRTVCEDPAKGPSHSSSSTGSIGVPIIVVLVLLFAAAAAGYWYYQKNGLPSFLGGNRDSSMYSSTADSGM